MDKSNWQITILW